MSTMFLKFGGGWLPKIKLLKYALPKLTYKRIMVINFAVPDSIDCPRTPPDDSRSLKRDLDVAIEKCDNIFARAMQLNDTENINSGAKFFLHQN